MHTLKTATVAVWVDKWEQVEALRAEGQEVLFLKVSAITEDEAIATLAHRLGNSCADHHDKVSVNDLPTTITGSAKIEIWKIESS